VPKRVLQDLGPGKDQKPFAVIEGYRAEELVISVRNPNAMVETNAVDRSAGATSTNPVSSTRDTGVEMKSLDASFVGSTWTGNSVEAGDFAMKFLNNGKVEYIITVIENGVSSPRTFTGTWKRSGNDIQIQIGNAYSVFQGTIDGNVMKLEGTNQEGHTWKWTLFKEE